MWGFPDPANSRGRGYEYRLGSQPQRNDREIPVGFQDLKAPSLLPLECPRVRKQPAPLRLGDRARCMGRRHIRIDNRHPVIPPPILGAMVPGPDQGYLENPALFDLLVEQGQVVLTKEIEELLLVPPADFVVVLDDKAILRRRNSGSLGAGRRNDAGGEQSETRGESRHPLSNGPDPINRRSHG